MAQGSEIMVDRDLGTVIINETDVDTGDALRAARQTGDQAVNGLFRDPAMDAIVTWTTNRLGGSTKSRKGGIFDRDKFVTPDGVFAKMRVAEEATKDDIVASFLDSSEALAFSRISVECDDEDEQDIWEQIADDIDLNGRMREIWRELNIYSQSYVATWFGQKDYQIRGKSDATGIQRKKKFQNLTVPLGITTLDPFKVIPVGNFLFNQETLCLPGGSQVYTTEGPVAIEHVRTGQEVWSLQGQNLVRSRVTNWQMTGVKPTLKLETERSVVDCTANHPVLVMSRQGTPHTREKVEFEWVSAGEVRVGDFLVCNASIPESVDGPYPSEGMAKLAGILVGDGTRNVALNVGKTPRDYFYSHVEKQSSGHWLWSGHCSLDGQGLWQWNGKTYQAARIAWQAENGSLPDKSVRLLRSSECPANCVNPSHRVLNKTDGIEYSPVDLDSVVHTKNWQSLAAHSDDVDAWQMLIENECGVPVQRYPHPRSEMAFQLHFCSADLRPWVAEVLIHKSPDRFVPSWVWTAPTRVKKAFLEGYLEADGHESQCTKGAFRVGCSSQRLASELRSLCHYLGWNTGKLRVLPTKGNVEYIGDRKVVSRHDTFSFVGNRFLGRSIPTSYSWKQKIGRGRLEFDSEHVICRRVNKISSGPPVKVYDLEVGGTHNFIVDGIVVHNCYFADPTERDVIDSWLLGDDASGADPIIRRLIIGKYEPDFRDRKEIGNFGVDPNRLYILNPKYCWRHTVTKSGWQRFPDLRMESVFQLLDLKQQLRQMDRANLLGATNFITLIKKGTDKDPAKPAEIGALQEQVKMISQVPVIVGDHRLMVEIITPKTDHTLDADRYLGLDIRISGRLYGMFMTTHAGRDDSLKLARVVARGLESRRDQQRRAFVNNILIPTYELNPQLREFPRMAFHPKNISLDFDPSRATFLLDLHDRNDLSRASMLSEVDFDEAEEAKKVRIEREKYDPIFSPPEEAPPVKTPAETINYKDVPPDVKRQIEKQAGLKPSTMDPGDLPVPAGGTKLPDPAPIVTPSGAVKKVGGTAKKAPAKDPKSAGRAQGGNHGHGGNGNIGRGAGQEAKPKPTAKPKVTGPTVSYSGTAKGIIGQPKGPGKAQGARQGAAGKATPQRKSPAAQQKKSESAEDDGTG